MPHCWPRPGWATPAKTSSAQGGPYLQRGVADLLPTAQLLDTYSPEIFCTIRGYHDEEPLAYATTGGGDGYALKTMTELMSGLGGILTLPGLTGALATTGLLGLAGLVGGAPNPYVYPDNLPRVNARGGPGGAPGCWQTITRDLWPAPELVMDTGASLAPYNHVDTGSPYAIEYVWGRQVGRQRSTHENPTGSAIRLGIVPQLIRS